MDQWISISEKLPEINLVVRVRFANGDQSVGEVKAEADGSKKLKAISTSATVTHWQAMPDQNKG